MNRRKRYKKKKIKQRNENKNQIRVECKSKKKKIYYKNVNSFKIQEMKKTTKCILCKDVLILLATLMS